MQPLASIFALVVLVEGAVAMDSPGKRRRELRAQLSDLSKRMKVEREKIARKEKHWNLQAFPTLVNTVVAVYVRTECDPQPVCEFLAREGNNHGWDDLDNDIMLLLALCGGVSRTASSAIDVRSAISSRAQCARSLLRRGTIRGNTPRQKTYPQNGGKIVAVFFCKTQQCS